MNGRVFLSLVLILIGLMMLITAVRGRAKMFLQVLK